MARGKASAHFAALLLLGMAAAASGQGICPPAFKGSIEKLSVPFKDTGDTSRAVGNVERYDSTTCRIPNESFAGGEAVYEVRLNPGNEVSFFLDVQGGADLMLALVSTCGDGTSCYSSSADFIGPGDEEIPAAKYPPGIYYLYIDSAKDAPGGPYELTVRGVNPTPDLLLKVDAPRGAFAGNSVTYNLSLTNRGSLPASNVEIVHTLPQGMALGAGSDCSGGRVTFQIETLEIGEKKTAKREVVARVCPGIRGPLTATAEARAAQGSPALPVPATIQVSGQSDLSLHMASSAASVVAGRPLTYTFTIHNAGPSDATQVMVVDTLSGKETFSGSSGSSADWTCSGTTTVSCGPLAIPVGDTVTGSITVDILSSALQPLVNRATVSAKEAEPGCKRRRTCGPNSDFIETRVERKTDLTIDLTQDPAGEIALGNDFSYLLKVVNNGPSDSSGATVDLRDTEGHTVTRKIGPLPSGGDDTVKIPVKTSPDGLPEQISTTASVAPKEPDPVGGNNETAPLKTTLKIQADLSIESDVDLTEVCAGGILVYTVTTVNGGPSNYRGGTISATLSEGLSFVSSPDGCTAGGHARIVTCKVPPLAVGKSHPVRIAALVTNTESEVSVTGMGGKVTKVLPHLVVSLSADSLVDPGEVFDYTVKVENRGPSDAEDVKVRVELPAGRSELVDLGKIPADKLRSEKLSETAPSASGSLTTRASLVNPARCSNTAEVTTAVTDTNGVALALTLAADAQAVAVGDTLTYTIQVDNQGPGVSPTVTITDELPPNTLYESASSGCAPVAGKVECTGLTLPAKVEITVQVLPGAQTPLRNTVSLSPGTIPGASIETPVLPGRLLLPFFEVDGRFEEVTTLLSLRNLGTADIRYGFLATSGPLGVHETATVNLRDVPLSGNGYVAISPDPPEAPLGGDFVHIDPTPGTASGGLLVPATEMCREWSVRFLNGGPPETGTDFLFFAPGNGPSPSPVVKGRVFNEKGQLVQELDKIPHTEESFRIRTLDLGLLATFGSIEWTFRDGIFGHVAAVHREEGKDEVAVPGFCRDRLGAEIPSTLILPWFKVNRQEGLTTLLTVRNETEVNATFKVEVGLVSAGGVSIAPAATYDVAGHAIRTVNLHDPFDVAEGFVRVTAPQSLSGDFIHIDPSSGRTGGVLVRDAQLCRCWDVRFVQGTPSGSQTDLLFYVEGKGVEGKGKATGTVYSESGDSQGTVETPLSASFLLPVLGLTLLPSGLGVTGSGAIEWDLGENTKGYVAALFTEVGAGGSYSVLVPGLCRATVPETEEGCSPSKPDLSPGDLLEMLP
jgi:uncharacterized repeat protein (TIGR01451 family)